MALGSSVLVVDLGGTFVRFATYQPCSESLLQNVCVYKVADYLSFEEALTAYQTSIPFLPEVISISVAGPAEEDRIELVNHGWTFSLSSIRQVFGFTQTYALNDFKSIACTLPVLRETDLEVWHHGRVGSKAAKIVLGPGTGLGLGVSQPFEQTHIAFATEGGNIGFAPQSDLQCALFDWARAKLSGRIYVEQLISGPGLCHLAHALADIEDEPLAQTFDSAQWVEEMLQADPFALRVMDCFAELLGSYAGDMVLAHGARAGAYLAGGVMRRLQTVFPREVFLSAFTDKGRYSSYLEQVPVYLCLHPQPGLLGAGIYACQHHVGSGSA